MNAISRRSALNMMLGAAVSVTVLGCAESAKPPAPPAAAPPRPPAPAAAGGELRRAFTESDWKLYRDCVNKTMRAKVGRVWRWKNPQSGNGGSMAPTSPAAPQVAGGQTCRAFRETITLKDGRSDSFTGQACQKPDGSWDIVG